jgi:hypothetical protein
MILFSASDVVGFPDIFLLKISFMPMTTPPVHLYNNISIQKKSQSLADIFLPTGDTLCLQLV